MNWTTLLNGFSQMIVLLILATVLFTLIYRLNIWFFRVARPDFVLNEAAAIYLAGVFISFALVLNSTFLTLNSYLSMQGLEEGLLIAHMDFYWIAGKLLLLSVLVYLLLLLSSVFLFTRLTVEIPLLADIQNNNRRSAILLSGFLIAIFYAFSNNIDLIFSSVFSNTNNAAIF